MALWRYGAVGAVGGEWSGVWPAYFSPWVLLTSRMLRWSMLGIPQMCLKMCFDQPLQWLCPQSSPASPIHCCRHPLLRHCPRFRYCHAAVLSYPVWCVNATVWVDAVLDTYWKEYVM